MSFKRDLIGFLIYAMFYCTGILIWVNFNWDSYAIYWLGVTVSLITAIIWRELNAF